MRVLSILGLLAMLLYSCKEVKIMEIEIKPNEGFDYMISNEEPEKNYFLDSIFMKSKGIGDSAQINRIVLNFQPKEEIKNIKIDSAFLILSLVPKEMHWYSTFFICPALSDPTINTNWNNQPDLDTENKAYIVIDTPKVTEKLDITNLYIGNDEASYINFPMILKLKDEGKKEALTYLPIYSSKVVGKSPKLIIYYKQ